MRINIPTQVNVPTQDNIPAYGSVPVAPRISPAGRVQAVLYISVSPRFEALTASILVVYD